MSDPFLFNATTQLLMLPGHGWPLQVLNGTAMISNIALSIVIAMQESHGNGGGFFAWQRVQTHAIRVEFDEALKAQE
jgi:hypothetical protein